MDVEQFMARLGEAGITVLIKVDHERMADRGRPWTIVMSGPGLGDEGLVRTDARSLGECLAHGISELKSRPGDWSWLESSGRL